MPIVTFNFGTDQVSEIDNRNLQEFPTFENGIEKFISGLSAYIDDRVGFRTEMISSFILSQDRLFGILAHPSYEYGSNGYIFKNADFQLTDFDYIDDFSSFTKRLQDYCQERDVYFLYSLEPIKQMVYTQYVADGINYKNDRLFYLLDCLEQKGVNHLYTGTSLVEASKTTQVYNVKYDAGHWNDEGAFIGFSEVINKIRETFPSVKPLLRSDYDITLEKQTTLPVSYFPIDEEIPLFLLKETKSTPAGKYNSEIKLNNQYRSFMYFKNVHLPQAPKILVFCGSYYNSRSKFLRENFSEVVMVHNYFNIINFDYYFNIFQPDIVLFESTDYSTRNTYFRRNELQNAYYNPSYEMYENLPVNDFAHIKNTSADLRTYLESSETLLNTVSFELIGNEVSYAYMQLDDIYYDFKLEDNELTKTINITLDKETILNAKKRNIVLISADKTKKNIINLVI